MGRRRPARAHRYERYKPTVCVDFDGVLHSFRGWDGYTPTGPAVDGSREFIRALQHDYTVVVLSSRADGELGRHSIRCWLTLWGFPDLAVTNIKVAAVAYIDDRAIAHVEGDDWDSTRTQIDLLARQPI